MRKSAAVATAAQSTPMAQTAPGAPGAQPTPMAAAPGATAVAAADVIAALKQSDNPCDQRKANDLERLVWQSRGPWRGLSHAA